MRKNLIWHWICHIGWTPLPAHIECVMGSLCECVEMSSLRCIYLEHREIKKELGKMHTNKEILAAIKKMESNVVGVNTDILGE